MLHYKPTPKKAVETTPAKNTKNVQLKKRYHVHPDGTISPIEDHLDWDFDKLNMPGE